MPPSTLLFAGLLTSLVLVLHVSALPTSQEFDVVVPQKLHSQYKRDTQDTYPDMVQYEFLLENTPLVLHLEKTEGLIHKDYTETSYQQDGTPTTSSPKIKDHCLYQGRVNNDPNSLVSLSTCSGLSGFIMTQGRAYLINPLKETDSEEHALYAYDPKEDASRTCGVTATSTTEDELTMTSYSINPTEKQEILNSTKYVQLYVVADNSMFKKYNSSVEILKKRIYEMINYANMAYKTLNVFVALCGIEIWENGDQFTIPTSVNTCLDLFTEWRRDKDDPNQIIGFKGGLEPKKSKTLLD
ncbi:zinc metalloproteinase-disintegrin-like VMP-III [Xenopus laevis]|uniref:Zinc metalloproteinase-disintegrin-like VMP-III n=1 Tax=Xenopus laevis TaxID=8355 RepID=A0A8J1MJ40_XENLA|nr:zinc metalloproteinase-disintegrin-like VMP-III [Xenopus laevis]